MTDTLIDRRDLSFQLYEVLGVEVLAEPRFVDGKVAMLPQVKQAFDAYA